jgi:CRISPR system Cascade subunit CasD
VTTFLLCTLYAPLASWGEIAVGEVRGSWERPSRSAVLGLVAAALGVDRADQEAHDALDRGYGVAVRLDAVGTAMVDYHTTQTVASSAFRGRVPRTRRALLEAGEHQTILSRRTYRQDAAATVAIWARDDARWALANIAVALRAPAYVPYAGRKANALGLPVHPELIDVATLADAFAARLPVPASMAEDMRRLRWLAPGEREIAHDPCTDGVISGLRVQRTETRRDGAAQRQRWQFSNRGVVISTEPTSHAEVPTEPRP